MSPFNIAFGVSLVNVNNLHQSTSIVLTQDFSIKLSLPWPVFIQASLPH